MSVKIDRIPNGWSPKDDPILDGHDRRCDFTPVLAVDIKTGKVLLDRLEEAVRRTSDRGGFGGRW